MKFGKLDDFSKVDFTLPPDHRSNFLNSKAEASANVTQVYIGATGWSMPKWKGKWYPSKTKTSDFLIAYSKQFNAIELNSTYYGIPKESTLLAWKEKTPDDFKFFPKVPQAISRAKDPNLHVEKMEHFLNACLTLEHKFEKTFMQLSPHQGEAYFSSLLNFLDRIPYRDSIFIEFRNDQLFSDDLLLDQIIRELKSRSVGLVLTDVSGKRELLHMACGDDASMVRFVGNQLDTTDFQRMDDWIERIFDWSQKGVKSIYFFVHQLDNLLAPELAEYLAKNLMSKSSNLVLRGPKALLDENPTLF